MPAGRPTKLTQLLQQKICEAIRAGNHLDNAATYAGIDRTSLHRWLRRGGQSARGLYRDFHLAVHKARADAEARAIMIVNKAALAGDWRAAAWYLERVAPDKWGRKDRIQATVTGGIAHAHVGLKRGDLSKLSNEELDELEKIYSKVLPDPDDRSDRGDPTGASGEGAP